MAKLTKAQAKVHAEACALLEQDTLRPDEIEFVYRNWNEAATVSNTLIGAHFTPFDLAFDFAIDAYNGGRVLDLCAGAGILSYANACRTAHNIDEWPEMVCIEANPDYVAVGKKLLPQAEWICADVFDLPKLGLGHFDGVISNPPFGRSAKIGTKPPRYTGADFDLAVIDLAADHADYGAFIIPQGNAPFKFSRQRNYSRNTSGKGFDFVEKTGMWLEAGCGVDCDFHRDAWKTVAPSCEIVTIDFQDWREGNTANPIVTPPETYLSAIATEPTEQGLQFIIPGCERDNSRKPGQLDLF